MYVKNWKPTCTCTCLACLWPTGTCWAGFVGYLIGFTFPIIHDLLSSSWKISGPFGILFSRVCFQAFRACCRGGAVTVAAFLYNMCARLIETYASCFMIHLFLTLGFIAYYDVNITIGVYLFRRTISDSCTVVLFTIMSFIMYLVRVDLIKKINTIYGRIMIPNEVGGNQIQ